MGGEEPEEGQSGVDFNSLLNAWGGQCNNPASATQKDVNRRLTTEEMEEEEANIADLESIAYMEAPTVEFENTFKWNVF